MARQLRAFRRHAVASDWVGELHLRERTARRGLAHTRRYTSTWCPTWRTQREETRNRGHCPIGNKTTSRVIRTQEESVLCRGRVNKNKSLGERGRETPTMAKRIRKQIKENTRASHTGRQIAPSPHTPHSPQPQHDCHAKRTRTRVADTEWEGGAPYTHIKKREKEITGGIATARPLAETGPTLGKGAGC